MLCFFKHVVAQIRDDAVTRATEERTPDRRKQILHKIRSEKKRNDYVKHFFVFVRNYVVDEHFRHVRRHEAERRYHNGHRNGKNYRLDFRLYVFRQL